MHTFYILDILCIPYNFEALSKVLAPNHIVIVLFPATLQQAQIVLNTHVQGGICSLKLIAVSLQSSGSTALKCEGVNVNTSSTT